ncbi:MAG: IS110 family transposase [Gammaproteobacteria bacterium]|nr:IS110 family transposase [Gammaproteobacteria bacterium]
MNKITTIGLDLAKNIFHLIGFDARGKEVKKKMLRRSQMLEFFAQLPPCLIGMEACASAHYWGRELTRLGHTVRLIPAQHVKPFVQGNKNDYNDARAIAEAIDRPKIHYVAIKTVDQQDAQALERLRQGALDDRTALCNRLRGLLGEYGLVVPKGVNVLRRRIPELLEDAKNGLSEFFRRLLAQDYQRLQELDVHIVRYTQELKAHSQRSDACQRLQTIPGYGPILASRFHGVVGDGKAYRRGRDVSAALGVVPRQHSSGGKNVLLGISKRGDGHLRALLIHGARSVVRHAAKKDDRLSRWINKIQAERGYNKATVALANKMARIGWAVLRNNTLYQAT